MCGFATPDESESPSGRDYLAALGREAQGHDALRHPWLSAMAEARFEDVVAALRDFALVHNGYGAWFVLGVEAILDRIEGRRQADVLRAVLKFESGELSDQDQKLLGAAGIELASVEGVPHRELFRRFCAAVGLSDTDLGAIPQTSQSWRLRLLRQLRIAPLPFAVGAMALGTQRVVRPIYGAILNCVRKSGAASRQDVVFFELHTCLGPQLDQQLLRVAESFTGAERDRVLLRGGMLFALELRQQAWDYLWARALRRTKMR